MTEHLSHDQIKEKLRTGWTLDMRTPGLQEAARELMRPMVESMEHREIIYECRIAWLMRVDYLETDDDGFRAVGTWVQEIETRQAAAMRALRRGRAYEPAQDCSIEAIGGGPSKNFHTLDFSGRWDFFHLCGSAIKFNMLTDCFYPDPAVVAEVKSAMARNAPAKEVLAILNRASNPFGNGN